MTTLKDRIDYAARVIREGRSTSRRFDSCFEMGDGDKVVSALVIRSRKNPQLREKLPRYIAQSSIDACNSKASATHTPGPWSSTPTTHPGSGTALLDIVSHGAEFSPCFIAGEVNPANARLIAAAPEMLDALQACIEWMEHTIEQLGTHNKGIRLNWGGPISKARDAVTHATTPTA